jgi:hypothetical protein
MEECSCELVITAVFVMVALFILGVGVYLQCFMNYVRRKIKVQDQALSLHSIMIDSNKDDIYDINFPGQCRARREAAANGKQ